MRYCSGVAVNKGNSNPDAAARVSEGTMILFLQRKNLWKSYIYVWKSGEQTCVTV